MKLLEKNIGKTFSDINSRNIFLYQSLKSNRNESKNKPMGSNQTYKLLHGQGNHLKKDKLQHGRKYLQTM